MSVAAWSLAWQVLVAATFVAYFGLTLMISRRAFEELWQMFHDLEATDDAPPPPND
jgi:hypothetical protein